MNAESQTTFANLEKQLRIRGFSQIFT